MSTHYGNNVFGPQFRRDVTDRTATLKSGAAHFLAHLASARRRVMKDHGTPPRSATSVTNLMLGRK
jgi:hypothetical protein